MNNMSPERTSASSLYSTDTVMTAPFSPCCSDTAIHSGTSPKCQSSELVTVTSFSASSTLNASSFGSTEMEYTFASCVTTRSISLSPQLKVNVAVLAPFVLSYESTVNVTLSPLLPYDAETSHQSLSPSRYQSSELVTVIVWSPPAAPNVKASGEIEIS